MEAPPGLTAATGNGEGGGVSYASLKTAEGCNALHLAAAEGKTTTCRCLIQKLNFDINATDNDGDTPLFQAILGRHRPTTIFLIDNGSDVTKVTAKDSLHCIMLPKKVFVKLLISKGADLRAISEAGTPLHSAAAHGNHDALKFLLELKEDPNSIAPAHMSPLSLSMLAESLECMELLLKAGAGTNGRASNTTPLCYAASELDVEVVRCLLKAGADPNISDMTGLTPLEYAVLGGFSEVVKLLFPITSHIPCYPDWSISGVMRHVQSAEARAQRESKRKEVFLLSKAKGGEAFERKDYEEAIYWYSQAVEADLSDAKVLSNRSLCWAQLNDGESALSDAQNCVGLEPSWVKAHYRVGAAWKLLKKYDKAAAAFHQALVLDPGNKEIENAYRAALAEFNKASTRTRT